MMPEHTAIWAKSLIHELERRGFGAQRIIGNLGIELRELELVDPKLPFDQVAVLFERAAELTEDGLIGFKHAQSVDVRQLGLIHFACSSSPNVRGILEVFDSFSKLFGTASGGNSKKLKSGNIEWNYRVPRSVVQQQLLEFEVTATVKSLRRLVGKNLRPETVDFRHHRSRNVEEMRKFFGCPVNFGADETRVLLKHSDLNLPLVTSDNHLHRLLLGYCEERLAKTKASKPPLIASIEELIAKKRGATQAEIAKSLGMSSRTLSRRLAAEGMTYYMVLDGFREAMAKSMIEGSALSLTEVAFSLGYSDQSSFSTAFRRWVGITPGEYRSRHSFSKIGSADRIY